MSGVRSVEYGIDMQKYVIFMGKLFALLIIFSNFASELTNKTHTI